MLKNKEIIYLVVNMKHGLVQDYFDNYNDAADCCERYEETFPDEGFKIVHLFEASEYEKIKKEVEYMNIFEQMDEIINEFFTDIYVEKEGEE